MFASTCPINALKLKINTYMYKSDTSLCTPLQLAGLGILGLGIYIIGSDYGAKQMSEILGNDLYQVSAYVLIASGALLIVFSMCGCCGAYRESRCMLGFVSKILK